MKVFGSRRFIVAVVIVLILVIAGALYELVVPGLSVARREPLPFETAVATWLLHQSVPEEAKRAANPLGAHPEAAELAAGHDLFRQKCEICHAYDGDGKTEIGAGQFP